MTDERRPDFSNTPVSSQRPKYAHVLADLAAEPVVSIVTPVLNPGPEFVETKRSLLQQSFQQWEWIVVDDGSTALDSLALLAEQVRGDPRIRRITLPRNTGLSAARNRGVAEARADFTVLLDGDDLMEPSAVEKWLWYLVSNPHLSFCKGFSVGFGAQEYLWRRGFHDGPGFLDENLVDVTSMLRTRLVRDIGGFDESIRAGLEDWDFWLRAAHHGAWGDTVPEYLNWYRRRPDPGRWANLASGRLSDFGAGLRARYSTLTRETFPVPFASHEGPDTRAADRLHGVNALERRPKRLLLLEQTLGDEPYDRAIWQFIRQLIADGWEATVVATGIADSREAGRHEELTPDVFVATNFVHPALLPVFIDYLSASRGFTLVCVSRSELGLRLVPELRASLTVDRVVELRSRPSGSRDDAHLPDSRARQPVSFPELPLPQELAAFPLPIDEHARPLQPHERLNIVLNALWAERHWSARERTRRESRHDMRVAELEAWTSHQQRAIDMLTRERDQLRTVQTVQEARHRTARRSDQDGDGT